MLLNPTYPYRMCGKIHSSMLLKYLPIDQAKRLKHNDGFMKFFNFRSETSGNMKQNLSLNGLAKIPVGELV